MSPRTPFINVGSPRFSQFQYFEHFYNTFPTYPTINMSSQQENTPISSTTSSTSGVTVGPSQQSTTNTSISLSTCLIPTSTVGINTTSMAKTSVTIGSSGLFSQSYIGPFRYGMPTWTPIPHVNTMSQPFIPSMSAVLGIPLNPFNPSSFGMSNTPPPTPSLASGYMPSTSHPIHNVPTQ